MVSSDSSINAALTLETTGKSMNTVSVSLGNLPTGIYLLQVLTDNDKVANKIIKN